MQLAINDYEKMIYFSTVIAQATDNFREVVQEQLATLFQYDHTLIWLADDKGNLREPVNYNISDKTLALYLDKHRKQDYLYPAYNIEHFTKHSALRLHDVTTYEAYEQSDYYREFMQPNGFYDEMVVALRGEHGFIGAIGMASSAPSRRYTLEDALRFEYLSQIIATTFSKQTYGYTPLSKREREIIALVKLGWTNQRVGEELYISVNTVKKHLQNIYEKYQVQNKTQLVQRL